MDLLVGVTSPSTQNSDSNLLDDMRREAETNALRIIQAKLEKPENLEKLDQLRTAAAQRKVNICHLLFISISLFSFSVLSMNNYVQPFNPN
jgi:hypothetical protein